MGENSAIEWTHHTFNPWIGCTKVAAGCELCYAESYAKRYGKAQWGPSGTRVKTSDAYWRNPIKWNEHARISGERRRVFCASLADVFEEWDAPVVNSRGDTICRYEVDGGRTGRELKLDDLRRELFKVIDATPWLDWLLLTKRPENIPRMWATGPPADFCPFCDSAPCQRLDECSSYAAMTYRASHKHYYRHNAWLLTSIATQADADKNVPELLKCRDLVPVLGLSAEPLLGPISLTQLGDTTTGIRRADGKLYPLLRYNALEGREDPGCPGDGPKVDWVIAGGESGHGARPMHPDWARSLRDQCQAAGVPFFFKQWGEWCPWVGRTLNELKLNKPQLQAVVMPDGSRSEYIEAGGALMARIGKKAAGRLLDGKLHDEYPAAVPRVEVPA